MITDCFRILAIICFAVWIKRAHLRLGSFTIALVLLGFFMVKIGKLHRSRSNTRYALFWAAGIIHLWIRPLTGRRAGGAEAARHADRRFRRVRFAVRRSGETCDRRLRPAGG